jgi:hypothetical protein
VCLTREPFAALSWRRMALCEKPTGAALTTKTASRHPNGDPPRPNATRAQRAVAAASSASSAAAELRALANSSEEHGSYFTAMTYPEGLPSVLQPSDLHDALSFAVRIQRARDA